MTARNTVFAAAILAAASLSAATALAEPNTLKAGDVSTMDHWYGRAGGLVGAQRIASLHADADNPAVTVTYDREVAERTNMPLERSSGEGVAITYDREVAARTNMERIHEDQPMQAAGVRSSRNN